MDSQKWNQGPKWIPVVVQEGKELILLQAEPEDGRTWRRHQDHLLQNVSRAQMSTQALVILSLRFHAKGYEIVKSTMPVAKYFSKVQDSRERPYPVRNHCQSQYSRVLYCLTLQIEEKCVEVFTVLCPRVTFCRGEWFCGIHQ